MHFFTLSFIFENHFVNVFNITESILEQGETCLLRVVLQIYPLSEQLFFRFHHTKLDWNVLTGLVWETASCICTLHVFKIDPLSTLGRL